MKKLLSIILSVCMILSVCTVPVFAEDTIKITVDGNVVDCAAYGQEPTAINGTTLVPLRSVFEALGATVAWDGDTQTVVSARGADTITLKLNSTEMMVNGEVKVLSVPAQSMNERTMVPVRAIAEAFGCDVKWDGDTRTVIVSTLVNADETPEAVVTKVYDAILKLDFDTAKKYFMDETVAEDYLGDMDVESALGNLPGMELDQRMQDTMVEFFVGVMSLATFEIKNVTVGDDVAYIEVVMTVPDFDKIEPGEKDLSEEEAMELTIKALEKCGLTMEEVENTTDPTVQEEFMYAIIEVSFEWVLEFAKEEMQNGAVLTETDDVILEKVNGRWLIVE